MRAARVLAAALLAIAACGCVVRRLPPGLSGDDRALVASCAGTGGACVVVGADTPRTPYDGLHRNFVEPLRETGVFRTVTWAEPGADLPAADWYVRRLRASQDSRPFGPHAGPEFLVLLFTFGIVPNVRDDDRGMSYQLSSRGDQPERHLHWDEPAFMMAGLFSLALAPLPGMRAGEDMSEYNASDAVARRDAERLALEICRSGALGGP